MNRFVVNGMYHPGNDIEQEPRTIAIGSCEFSDGAKFMFDVIVENGKDLWYELAVFDTDTGEALHTWRRN